MPAGEEPNEGPASQGNLCAGFTDLNGKSLQTSVEEEAGAAGACVGATWGGFQEMKERRGWLMRRGCLMLCQKAALTSKWRQFGEETGLKSTQKRINDC